MEEVLGFVVPGIVLGLGAGLAPGPLLVLVVAHSVRHGTRAGIKVAIAPLITDLPIIGLAVLALTGVAPPDGFLGVIAIAGATFLGYLSYESLTVAPQSAVAHAPRARSLRTGIIANLLNPYPYLFWLTVGAPTVMRARRIRLACDSGFSREPVRLLDRVEDAFGCGCGPQWGSVDQSSVRVHEPRDRGRPCSARTVAAA